ncbi:MAG TPA: ABC transporter permease [Thermoanaerobaculia bacterium]|nr:ABC transporter permease [Thermoanaerobaculia bacterium]
MNQLWTDLRYAARVLARTPAFTAVALLTLALAIGANTAIFSVANALLLKPLPFPEAGRLLQVMRQFPDGEGSSLSIPKFVYWRDHNRVLEHLAAFDSLGSGFNLAGEGRPERIVGSRVSRDFLAVFGARPALGRDFLPEEDRPGARRVVLLSDGLWRRRFGGERAILGREMQLNGVGYTVIGVLPPSFQYPLRAELWTPLDVDPASREKANYLEVVGRLRPGVTPAQAQAGMKVLFRQFAAAFPDQVSPQESTHLLPLRERLYGRLRPALLVLLSAVGCVLLIACVNIANLQLARATARRREIAIRSVVGASSGTILRQLLTESLLLALAGGAAGLLVGYWSLKPLLALRPEALDRLAPMAPVTIDGNVLAFTLGISLLAGLLFGLAPALQAVRADPAEPLKEGSNRSTGGKGGLWTRRLLVVSEVALALVLLTGAALLGKSFAGLVGTAPGFAPDHVLTMKLSLPENRYGDPAALERFGRLAVERIAALPGVQEAAAVTSLPMEDGPDLTFTVEGQYKGGAKTGMAAMGEAGVGDAQYRAMSPRFFAALRIPIVRGRGFTDGDAGGRELVAIVNETLAKRHWPKEDALGKRITVGPPAVPDLADPGPRTIVGIVKDVREAGLEEAAPEILYVPVGQVPLPVAKIFVRLLPLNLVVRTAVEPASLTTGVEKAIASIDPAQPVNNVLTMEEVVSRSLGLQRFETLLLGVLALVALVLAAVGIYGVLSYLVNQRTREIGVRMALGATSPHVLGLVIRQGIAAVLVGVAVGLAGAFALTRLLASLLVGVSARDPLTFLLAPALLTAVALAASSLPARRASRLDPLVALRQE